MPTTAMMYRFLAPLLSAQFISVDTLRPRDMRSLPPLLPPRPRFILQFYGLVAESSPVGGSR